MALTGMEKPDSEATKLVTLSVGLSECVIKTGENSPENAFSGLSNQAAPPCQNPVANTVQNGSTGKGADFGAQYRELVRRRVLNLCGELGCGNPAERYFRCADHAPAEPMKRPRQNRPKQATFRL